MGIRRRSRLVLALALVGCACAQGTLVGCSSSEPAQEDNEKSGEDMMRGTLGVGPLASAMGAKQSLGERLAAAREAMKSAPITAELIQDQINALKYQPGDPARLDVKIGRVPTPDELRAAVESSANQEIPSDAQYEKIVELAVTQVNTSFPEYPKQLKADLESGDAQRVSAALARLVRTLTAVFSSRELGARMSVDPDLKKYVVKAGAGSLNDPNGIQVAPFMSTAASSSSSPSSLGGSLHPTNTGGGAGSGSGSGAGAGAGDSQGGTFSDTSAATKTALVAYLAGGVVLIAVVGVVVNVAAFYSVYAAAVKGALVVIPGADPAAQGQAGELIVNEMWVRDVTLRFAKHKKK